MKLPLASTISSIAGADQHSRRVLLDHGGAVDTLARAAGRSRRRSACRSSRWSDRSTRWRALGRLRRSSGRGRPRRSATRGGVPVPVTRSAAISIDAVRLDVPVEAAWCSASKSAADAAPSPTPSLATGTRMSHCCADVAQVERPARARMSLGAEAFALEHVAALRSRARRRRLHRRAISASSSGPDARGRSRGARRRAACRARRTHRQPRHVDAAAAELPADLGAVQRTGAARRPPA